MHNSLPRPINRRFARWLGLVIVAVLGWWWVYEGHTRFKRKLTKREKIWTADLRQKFAKDPRFHSVGVPFDHSDRHNIMHVTGVVYSLEAEAALYTLLRTSQSNHQIHFPVTHIRVVTNNNPR